VVVVGRAGPCGGGQEAESGATSSQQTSNISALERLDERRLADGAGTENNDSDTVNEALARL